MLFDNIPSELRVLSQWVTWRFEDHGGAKPTKVPYNPIGGYKASHSDPFTWTSFDACVNAVHARAYDGIGFVLAESDPYAFIDLDDVHEDLDAQARQVRIFEAFDSYAEISPSGKGLHIIIKGSVPSGRKRAFVEVYSTLRFMTMTGNVYRAKPISGDFNPLLNSLWEQMGGNAIVSSYAGDVYQKEEDMAIVNKALKADNGDKFNDLMWGRWNLHYSSQSEADLALINILAFYTQHKPQIIRLFRQSGLGQRPKALRNDYVDYMVAKSFDRLLPPVDIDGIRNQIEAQLAERRANPPPNPFNTPAPAQQPARDVPAMPKPVVDHQAHITKTEYHVFDNVKPLNMRALKVKKFEYVKPPGLIGEIASFIYAAAPRPVPEIALTAALALMSGICGRAYNVSNAGLNQYILLLAPTGSGKEAIASGIDKLMASVRMTVPAAAEFIGPAEIASPEALLKYMNYASCSFVSMIGEFGLKLKQMATQNASPQMAGLKRMLLDLYNKSGEGKLLHPMIYSDKTKNTDIIEAPAFSLMGESVPGRFYEVLDEAMISEGLLPRFTIIEYNGDRPPLNERHHEAVPSVSLIEQVSALCGHALMLNKAKKAITVNLDPNAEKLFRDFDKYCDDRINSGSKEVVKHLWNRAHMKSMKLAALVAVGNSPYDPRINGETAQWAIDLVVHDAMSLLERFETGKVGATESSDTKQIEDMVSVIGAYLEDPHDTLKKYHVPLALHSERVLPWGYLARRLSPMTSFKNDRFGATAALKKCVQALVDRGDLQELSRNDTAAKFKTTAKCFVISNVHAFLS